jgi:hypothetical protein
MISIVFIDLLNPVRIVSGKRKSDKNINPWYTGEFYGLKQKYIALHTEIN